MLRRQYTVPRIWQHTADHGNNSQYIRQCTDVRPCRDTCLLKKAAWYLLMDPEPSETFVMLPFYQALSEGCGALSTDYRKVLSAFIRAAELLETICLNLFLQPWKKEIRTLKTFTGPFVYCLLPVLSSSTIQSVLASIGYLPHTDTPQSEYRLREDANPDRAMLVAFELLLARVECYHLLELLDNDQMGPQERLEVLHRRVRHTKLEAPTEKKTMIEQKEEEVKKKTEEADGKEVPPYLDTRLAVNHQPKPRCCNLISEDQSIMEMQMTYPDLAFRGRPLLPDKPYQANTSKSSSKAVHTAGTNNYSDGSKAAELPRRDCMKNPTNVCSKNHSSTGLHAFGDNGRSSGSNDRNTSGDTISSRLSNTDGSRVDDELIHPQAISQHITLKDGSMAEWKLKPGKPQPISDPPTWTQQRTIADLQNKRQANPGLPSLSSMDKGQELRETKKELKMKKEHKRGEENTNKERRKKERKADEQNLRMPVMETGPGLSHAARRCTRSSQADPAVMKEQKQPTPCHPSPLTISTADCQTCKGGSTEQQDRRDTERAETGRGEEEHLAQSYVIVEHDKK
ncbi:uncharacterized protein LOC121613839 isoform X2 [Chelmon rostratus]|uniref:uncharacterized protein LOC121613839 isoform X2 n=1 Tax=Chelmon rostratus TaxID=109905 RepID=UPI001BE9C792|nr:uncharacterized protein LOC121613839 isoform X2 [Chelmon rostratus]